MVVARRTGDALHALGQLRYVVASSPASAILRAPFLVQRHGTLITQLTPYRGGRLFDASGDALVRRASFEPPNLRPHAAAIVGDRLIVGGIATGRPRGERDPLVVAPLDALDRWTPLEVPSSLRWYDDKGVDALLVDGDRLIAVDNVREPKWILTYALPDLTPTGAHDLSRTARGTEIVTAVLGPTLALLTVVGDRTAVDLHDRTTFAALASLDQGAYGKPDEMWRALAFFGDILYVAAGTRGLGVITKHTITYRPHPRPVRFVTATSDGLYLHTPGHGGLSSEHLVL